MTGTMCGQKEMCANEHMLECVSVCVCVWVCDNKHVYVFVLHYFVLVCLRHICIMMLYDQGAVRYTPNKPFSSLAPFLLLLLLLLKRCALFELAKVSKPYDKIEERIG